LCRHHPRWRFLMHFAKKIGSPSFALTRRNFCQNVKVFLMRPKPFIPKEDKTMLASDSLIKATKTILTIAGFVTISFVIGGKSLGQIKSGTIVGTVFD